MYDAVVTKVNPGLNTLNLRFTCNNEEITCALNYWADLGLRAGMKVKVETNNPGVGGTIYDIQRA